MLRINQKVWLLTYSQCATDIHHLLKKIKEAFLLERKNVKKYLVCHETHQDGNPHRHAWIELDTAIRGSVDAKFLDVDGCHPNIQAAKSPKACLKYCAKKNDYISNFDVDSMLAEKVTKKDIALKLMNGADIVGTVQEHPNLLFGLKRMLEDLSLYWSLVSPAVRLLRPQSLWICGRSGVGKSFWVRAKAESKGYSVPFDKGPHKWWCGYRNQQVVHLEDLGIDFKDYTNLLKLWSDVYPFTAETKGGNIVIRPAWFIVTSNLSIEEYLESIRWPISDYAPYLRRFEQHCILQRSDLDNIVLDGE